MLINNILLDIYSISRDYMEYNKYFSNQIKLYIIV